MRSRGTRNKHWLLLSFLLMTALAFAPLARAQSQNDQDPNQIQAADPLDGQNGDQVEPGAPIAPEVTTNGDSHARIVRVSYVEGEVRIDRGQGYESATMNVPVTERNWLQTRSDGWAEVQTEDGSMIRLAPDTVIAFTELSRTASGGTITTVDLDQGEAEFKIAKHDDSDFQVTVRNKTVMLDGSSWFRVTSVTADPMEVVVWKGQVAVRDSDSGDEVAVKKNETFVLDATDLGRYALDKGVEADALDQWSKQRDDYLSTYAARGGGYLQSPYQYGTGDLNYYGQYFDDPGYGTLWQPTGVNLGWNPFMNGYWAFTPGFGYTWVSAYPWGWMPYRYGRWVYVNNRGWCWAPGGWNNGWHTGPRWANAPPGFRPPVPPTDRRVVVSGAPGGRVIIPGNRNDRGGAGRTETGTDRPGSSRRVFTNDDVQARVPRTDVERRESSPGGSVNMDHREPGDRHAVRTGGGEPLQSQSNDGGQSSTPHHSANMPPPSEGTRIIREPRVPQPTPPAVSQPVRSYTPPPQAPQHQSTPPPAPMHQSSPAPMRSYSPPAESHSAPNNGGSGSSRVR